MRLDGNAAILCAMSRLGANCGIPQTLERGAGLRGPEALLFDMDGVLLDSEELHRNSKEATFRHFGIAVGAEMFDRYKGRPDRTMVEDVVRGAGGDASLVQRVLAHKHGVFRELEHTLQAVEGATEFVHWAAGRFRLALATSATPRNREVGLRAIGAAGLFESVVDSSRVTEPKPAPEVFKIAMEDLGLAPDRCWVIEDSENGVVAGKRAGCTVVALTTTFPAAALLSCGADRVVDRFAELQSLLEATAEVRPVS